MNNRRTGKIARLPYEARRQVNEMIRDGRPVELIIEWLNSHGYGKAWLKALDFDAWNAQNFTNWQQGGYIEWLDEQRRLDDMAARREFAMEIVRQNEGSKIHEAALHMATSQLYEILSEYDLESLKEKLKDDPDNYAAVVNSLAKLSKQSLEVEKYRDAMAKAQAEIQKLRDPSQKLSDTERDAIMDEVDRILGLKK